MTYISYAQNFEDVMLRRALTGINNGFYIDVGAAWPDQDSVTKSFYDMGWSGVNIEPNPAWHKLLEKTRARDINLQCALGEEKCRMDFYIVKDSGLSSLICDIAVSHGIENHGIEQIEVDVLTLDIIWDNYVGHKEVHFLKVDVEGFESQVLKGNNWKKKRPWIVLVEATKPMSQAETYSSWECILLENDYVFAYADGLNRFYIASEHKELLKAFEYPPNVFDDFKSARLQQIEERVDLAEAEAKLAQEQMNNVFSSASWRITTPLRELKRVALTLKYHLKKKEC